MNAKRSGKPAAHAAKAAQERLQMADIARLAGVATSTVSRALKGSPLVNDATRTRIIELARKYNYTINRNATDLRSGTNRTIAVVVPYEENRRQNFSDPFLHGMIGALADELTERGYEMLLVRLDAERLDSVAPLVDGGRAAGVILIGQWHQHDQLNAMADRGLPLVVWGAALPDQRYCCVGGRNVEGGRLVGEHLLQQGCRRIAFLGDRALPEVAQRYRGFMAAMRRHGLRHDPELRIASPFLAPAGRVAVLDLVDRKVYLDGIFAASDLLAMAAIGALRERGLDVPRDILVAGYDDVDFAAHFHPPLTTIRQSFPLGARTMVGALLELLGEHDAGSSGLPHQLLTELIVRDSTLRDRTHEKAD